MSLPYRIFDESECGSVTGGSKSADGRCSSRGSRGAGGAPRRAACAQHWSDRTLFEHAQCLIRSHFSEPTLNLGTVARLLDVSRWRLSRAFSGCDAQFRSCVRHTRMLQAAHRLQAPVAIKEVAIDVGYRYMSDFTRHFREHWGMTPRTFREHAEPQSKGRSSNSSSVSVTQKDEWQLRYE